MTGDPPLPPGEPENPMEALFERAVKPFGDAAELKAALPPGAPVIVMRRSDELPSEAREVEGGATVTVPVLAALKDSTVARWHRAAEFDFAALKDDEVAIAFLEQPDGPADLKVITRAAGGALLAADLGLMLDALKELVESAAFTAFPGGDFLAEALASGIESAKKDLLEALSRPDASGKSLTEQFREKDGAHGRTRDA